MIQVSRFLFCYSVLIEGYDIYFIFLSTINNKQGISHEIWGEYLKYRNW